MQCSPSSSTVAVGCMTGHVYFVEMTDVEKPRLIYRSHLHHGPVLQLRYVCVCDCLVIVKKFVVIICFCNPKLYFSDFFIIWTSIFSKVLNYYVACFCLCDLFV